MLRASLVLQCSHSPHRQCFERRLTHSHWMPASHSNKTLTCTSGIQPAKLRPKYGKGASRLHAFEPGTGPRPFGMDLPQAAWVTFIHLRTGVGRFHSSMHKWGLAPSPNCECGAFEQTADYVLTTCPIHPAPHGARGLTVLDDKI